MRGNEVEMNKAPPFEKGWKHSDGVRAERGGGGGGKGDEKLGSESPAVRSRPQSI